MAEQTRATAGPGTWADDQLAATVEKTLRPMSLRQKCAFLGGATAFGTRPYQSPQVPRMQFSDGPHGMRHQKQGNHLGLGESDPATCFPTAVTVANSWDPSLGEDLGRALAEEAASQGVGVVLGPGLNIKRSPLCGRAFEYFSEDPVLAGKMAAGYVRGIQSTGVSACPKHFAVNSQETRRQSSDSVIDERTLRELYLRGFEIVVRESAPKCLMTSYNRVNGTYANENPYLLQHILRDEWGYRGAVVTDWGGSNDHVAGVAAGSDFMMPDAGFAEADELLRAVLGGRLSEAVLDARVREGLTLVLGTAPAVAVAPATFDVEGHHRLAQRIAAESIVLLKNEPQVTGGNAATWDGHPILPLRPGTRVALVGDFAAHPRYQGAGSSLVHCTKLDTLLDQVRDSGELELAGYAQGFERTGKPNQALVEEAVRLARDADVVLACLGLDESRETEGADRENLLLGSNQVDCLRAVARENPNVVVLLSAGGVVETDWAKDARALVYLALGGQAGAAAAYDVLLGRTNPSGKLAESWPWHLSDTPTYGNFPSLARTAEYREGPYVGYRYYHSAGMGVADPFGFGLSYTRFEYQGLNVAENGMSVSFCVTNVGDVAGAEVVQVYVDGPRGGVFRPTRQLAGFAKVRLEPGQTKRVTVALDRRAYEYFNVRTDTWEEDAGTYLLCVGASSEDIRLTAAVVRRGTGAPDPYAGVDVRRYQTADVRNVPAAAFAALLGRELPSPRIPIDRNMCLRDLNHGRSPVFWAVWAGLTMAEKAAQRRGRPNTGLEFVYNMPLRSFWQMSGGRISPFMVDGLVNEIRGLWGLGLAQFALGFPVNAARNLAWSCNLAATDLAAEPGSSRAGAGGLAWVPLAWPGRPVAAG